MFPMPTTCDRQSESAAGSAASGSAGRGDSRMEPGSGTFDSHAHFPLEGIPPLLERAAIAGVGRVMAVGGDAALNAGALKAAEVAAGSGKNGAPLFPVVGVAQGLDRSCAGMGDGEVATFAAALRRLAADPAVPLRALGEIGLDYHYDPEGRAAQRRLFGRMLGLAAELALPVVIHTREADEDTLSMLREHVAGGAGGLAAAGRAGVIHCFTGGAKMAEACLGLGFFVSFSGIVTFRNADALRDVARRVPSERLLVETDCPFLTPVPLRGRPNEPAFVAHTVACLARVRRADPAELAAATTANARRLFGL